jgi:hypothetical protein
MLTYTYSHSGTAFKKKEILSFVTALMNLENIVLSGIGHPERQIQHNLTYVWNLKMSNS